MRSSLALVLAPAVLALGGCQKPPPGPLAPQPPVTLADGLIALVLRPGDGTAAKAKDKITVHYVGTLLDGTKFDGSRDKDQPFKFWLGERQVIKGWDLGLLGMKEGELRKLTVPPDLGYGSEKQPKIPANSTLVFEIELLDVR